MAAAETKHEGEPEIGEGGQVILFTGKFEGVKVTDFAVNFSGNIPIGYPELIKSLALDEEVTLIVKGRVTSRSHRKKNAKDGAKSEAVSSSTVLVQSIALEA